MQGQCARMERILSHGIHSCSVRRIHTWAKVCAAPMPTLVMPQIRVPIDDRMTLFIALPADPTKGVIAACSIHP